LADTALAAGVRREAWPAWQRFKLLYLNAEGRVVDASTTRQMTTSEGQAHALFLALVGNDRAAFDEILRWTQIYLAAGSLERNLAASQWGCADNNNWRVLDPGPASNADVWIAYTLGEAGRLWSEGWYSEVGAAVASNILRQEVVTIPGLGPTLLPGPYGFITDDSWRLNPSHSPLPVLRALARQTGDPVWNEVAQSSERVILGAAPQGFVADWVEFNDDGFAPDRESRAMGGYDAMRVYLWAGMLPASDPSRDRITAALKPMVNSVAKRGGLPMESIDTLTLEMRGDGSPGFSAALLPMLANARLSIALQTHRKRAADESLQGNQSHLSDALALFGLGWLEQRYRFNPTGLLSVRWTPAGDRPH
ncbi:MAG: cellulose synthase complex periplasmic endoglucanase BcsZ, partial [Steroidobacter sp.]